MSSYKCECGGGSNGECPLHYPENRRPETDLMLVYLLVAVLSAVALYYWTLPGAHG